jgi:hypothetical protein
MVPQFPQPSLNILSDVKNINFHSIRNISFLGGSKQGPVPTNYEGK